MKIECLIRRPKGSVVTLGVMAYHFKPSADDPRHIASVEETAHVQALLRITEGYRSAEDEAALPDVPVRKLNGSTIHNQSYEIAGGDQISLTDLVDMAFDESGLAEEAWNALPDQERYQWIDQVLKELTTGSQADAKTASPAPDAKPNEGDASDDTQQDGESKGEDDPDVLIAQYKKLFGRAPNKRMTAAQIKRAVKDA